MPGFLFTPLARWIIAVLLVLGILGGVYYKGRLDERVIFTEYKAQIQAAADAQAEDAARKNKKNAKLILETKNAYNNQLADLRNYYGLRITKGSGTLSAVPGTPGRINDYSPDNLPPTPILAAQCAEETLKLLKLQEFNSNVAENLE
jgi:hypothetical protein